MVFFNAEHEKCSPDKKYDKVVLLAIEFQGVPRVFRIGHKENMVIEYVYFDRRQAECKKKYCIPQTLYPSKFDGVAI